MVEIKNAPRAPVTMNAGLCELFHIAKQLSISNGRKTPTSRAGRAAQKVTGKMGDVGALEILLSQGRSDFVELTFDADQNCYVATLMVEDSDEPEPVEGDEDELSPSPYDREFGSDDDTFLLKEFVSASGRTLVEALLQLELAYRNTIGAK